MGVRRPWERHEPSYSDPIFFNPAPSRAGAVLSFLLSLTIHCSLAALMWNINPRPTAKSFRAPTVDEILAQQDRRIVWYSPKAELPPVRPAEQPAVERPAERPRYRLPQKIGANQPDPQSQTQLILADAPEIAIEQDLELPNMLSWQAPRVERPRFELAQPKLLLPPELKSIEPPEAPKIEAKSPIANLDPAQLKELSRLRYLQRQRELSAPERKALEAIEAPSIQASKIAELDASRFQQLSKLRYQARQATTETAPERRALEPGQAPVVSQTPPLRSGINPAELQPLSRLRYQAGSGTPRTQAPQQQALGDLGGADAPAIAAAGAVAEVDVSQYQPLSRLRYQGQGAGSAQAAPQAAAVGAVAGPAPQIGRPGAAAPAVSAVIGATPSVSPPASLGDAQGSQPGGTAGERNLAVVGVNPSERIPAELPRGSRRGAFSAGPDASPEGGIVGAASEGAPLAVPGLSIEGSNASDDLRRFTRTGGYRELAALPPADFKIEFDPRQIDVRNPFVGRPVYKVAINMPNVTSYKGDWVIQFAELVDQADAEDAAERVAAQQLDVEPPYPVIKVDPKYIVDAARERIEGEVIFYAVIQPNGALENLTLVQSLDERLDQTAEQALLKWVFEPARKQGRAVAVEALVRIPFQLDPNVKVLY